MTPQQIALVKMSWQQLKPISAQAAALFYGRLFELDPSLRPLFRGDMAEQGRKLMGIINIAVSSLERLEQILPAVQDLGRRHVHYGVTADHYATVGAALLWTLEQGLGATFTPATQDAWTQTYTTLANVMQEAAATAAA